MASDWQQTCDAVMTDIMGAGITGLSGASQHKYEPWDPAAFTADGQRHVAVWPLAEELEEAEDSYLGSEAVELVQRYRIAVWEPSGTEANSLVPDEAAAAAFLQLHNDVRKRLMQKAQLFAGAYLTRYERSELQASLGAVRWFRIQFVSRRAEPLI